MFNLNKLAKNLNISTFHTINHFKKPLLSLFFVLNEKTAGFFLYSLDSFYEFFSYFPGENPLLKERERFVKTLNFIVGNKIAENITFLIKKFEFFDWSLLEVIENNRKDIIRDKIFWNELFPLILTYCDKEDLEATISAKVIDFINTIDEKELCDENIKNIELFNEKMLEIEKIQGKNRMVLFSLSYSLLH